MIPLARPFFDADELEEVHKVLESGWVSQGPKVREFERKVADYVGARYAVAVSNCTAALHLANLALGITKGDEVLVADYTFPATGHAVHYCGAVPVFVDIDPRTYNIDPANIEEKITEKTQAIIPVHTFGQCADMDPILAIAKDHGLRVIEDAACALGSRYRARYAGAMGDIGCFSFHARKGVTTGEGGMAVTNDPVIAEKIRYLAVFGMTAAWDREQSSSFTIPRFCDYGYNYKMSDISAAIGVAQMRKIDRIIQRKRTLARCWDQVLGKMAFIEKPLRSRTSFHIYQSYVALVSPGVNRNAVIEKLAQEGIQAQIGTYASHLQPVYRARYPCPVSREIYDRALALPLYYSLSEDEIAEMGAVLKNVLWSCT